MVLTPIPPSELSCDSVLNVLLRPVITSAEGGDEEKYWIRTVTPAVEPRVLMEWMLIWDVEVVRLRC